MNILKKIIKDEKGQALSEYALLLGVILLGVVVVVTLLKDKIVAIFDKIVKALSV